MKIIFKANENIEELTITIEDKSLSQNEIPSLDAQKIIQYLNDYVEDNSFMLDKDNNKIKIFFSQITYFFTQGNEVYAKVSKDTYKIKNRIYELETILPNDTFVKINQGVIANIKRIKRVKPCMNGTMMIEFIDGSIEYASRRSVKSIKEKLSI